MSSKKIKRDEKDHPILPGAITFGTVVRPKSGRKERATNLKNEADIRLCHLMKKGVDKFTRLTNSIKNENERKFLEFQKKFAEAPKIAHLAHYNNKLNDLRCELEELKKSNNKIKISFLESFLKDEITTYKKKIQEVYLDIKNEAISREIDGKDL